MNLPERWPYPMRYKIIDWIKGLKSLPAGSIDMLITSPPYWGLRDYGIKGQLGLEDSIDEALNLGRQGLGFELNPEYEALIKETLRMRTRHKKQRYHVDRAKKDSKQQRLL